MPSSLARGANRAFGWARDAWLMIGIMVLMLLALEVCYRAQAGVRKRMAGGAMSSAHPYANAPWFRRYMAEYDQTFRLRWKPYVYFRRPAFHGEFINVDSLGHRRTIPGPRSAADTVRVFVFGGSTMWGTHLRDSTTIPSVLATKLAAAAPTDVAFDVTNFGESGYVSTQGLLELQMQLRAGHLPDVVIFYDGINDVASAVQQREAGLPQNEFNRAREFDDGRAIYGSETGAGSEWRAAKVIGSAVVQRLQVVQRFAAALRRGASAPPPADLPRAIVDAYVANVDVVEALRGRYGFRALYVWQPTLQTTAKVLTPYETLMRRESERDEFGKRLRATHVAVRPILDSAMTRRVGSRFVDEGALFAGDTLDVFTDGIGHNTEKAIPRIVDGFYPLARAMADSARRDAGAPRPQRQRPR